MLARELETPIIVLSQLNRTGASDERPRLSHLRGSGAIEQDADVVLLMSGKRSDEKKAQSPVLLDIAKNRNGPTGEFHVMFCKDVQLFAPITFYKKEPETEEEEEDDETPF